MSSFPTVTITVNGGAAESTDSPEVLEQALHMVYVQAVKGDQRKQWVVFPPALKALGVPEDKAPAAQQCLMLSRLQEFKGNRSKWFHFKLNPGQTALTQELKDFENSGWTVGGMVVVPLEKDDYLEAWNGDTPHKAMRAIGRALAPLGITVK